MNPLRPGTHAYPTGQRLSVSLALKDNQTRWRRAAKRINDAIRALPYTKETVAKDEAPTVRKQDKRTAMLTNHLAASRYIWANNSYIANNELKYGNSRHLVNFLRKCVNEECVILYSQGAEKSTNEQNNAHKSVKAQNATRYEYQVSSTLMDLTMETIDNILEDDLLSGSDFWDNRFWLNGYVESAVEDGTTDSFESAVRITAGTPVEQNIGILTAQQQLSSPAYMDRLRLVHGRIFEEMKGLTAEMKSQLRLTLTEGMARGVGVRDLTQMINKRLSVGMSRAKRIARTEINQAYRTAYMDEATELNNTALKDDDWQIKQMHRSALSPTTRDSHAARHGNIYTAAQQRNWWAENGNAINCLCSTLDVLVNVQTGEVLQSRMQKTMKKQKKQWFGISEVTQ